MTQNPEMVNLSFLSDTETDFILQVLQRDEELRKAEERRIRLACPNALKNIITKKIQW